VTSRRIFLSAVAGALALASIARAQPARRIPTVGFLTLGGVDSLAQFKDTMRSLGFVEGRDLVIERRSSEGTVAVLPGHLEDRGQAASHTAFSHVRPPPWPGRSTRPLRRSAGRDG